MNNKIVCPLCGQEVSVMSHHLRKHKLSKNNFLEQYPGFKMITNEAKENISKAQIGNFSRKPINVQESLRNNSKRNVVILNNKKKASGYYKSEQCKENMRKAQVSHTRKYLTDTAYQEYCDRNKRGKRPQTSETLRIRWTEKSYVDKVMTGHKKDYHLKQYSSGKFRSSYENEMATILDEVSIIYEYEPFYTKYTLNGKSRFYCPDFLLKDLNLVIEVKPNKFVKYEINQAKKNAILNLGYDFIFITEIELFKNFNELKENLKSLVESSTTIERITRQEIV